MKRVVKRFWVPFCLFLFLVFGSSFLSWPQMQVLSDFVCSTTWAVVTYYDSSGQVIGSSSTPYTECNYITYYYDDGTGGGGGGSTPPGDQEPPPGGGGGGQLPLNYDQNSNGIVDCYKTAVFHTTTIYLTSACDAVRGTGTHGAWDLALGSNETDGHAVYSVSSGTVEQVTAQRDPNTNALTGYGYYVKVKDSEGNMWIYAHLKGSDADPSGCGLTQGSLVAAGTTQIGKCDSTGTSSAAHLHLEYRVNNIKTCPSTKLGNCANKA